MAPAAVSGWARRVAEGVPGVRGSGVPSTLSLERWLLDSGSSEGADLLARRAGLPPVAALARQLVGADNLAASPVAGLATRAPLDETLALARVLALSASGNDERRVAMALYEGVLAAHGPAALHRARLIPQAWWHSQIVARIAVETGNVRRARHLLDLLDVGPRYRPALATDVRNPALDAEADSSAWLLAWNTVADWHGDDRVELSPGEGAAFDRFTTALRPGSADGPLVSVVVPCHRPDAIELRTAVDSVLRQTHGNLEVLLVDDASGADTQGLFEEVAASDPRIRVLRQPVNAGSYAARNRALGEARGEFIAFQDSDDWSHPRRLERQLQPLRSAGSRSVATHSRAIRASDALVLSYRSFPALRHNSSSIVFRREPVLERAGGFVASRKGADTEFALRLARAFPGGVHGLSGDDSETGGASLPVLAVVRLGSHSLSRGDFHIGYRSPDRWAFHDAYRHWHAGMAGAGHWHVPLDPAEPPFPVPRSYRSAPPPPRHYDCVAVFDGRRAGGTTTRTVRALRDWSGTGLSVGFVHLPSQARSVQHPESVRADLLDLVAEGCVDRLVLDDSVTASRVIVPDASVLVLLPAGPWNLRVGSVVAASPRGRTHADRDRVERSCRSVFGRVVTWSADPLAAVDGVRV
jgi:glycosyltransferase involved in cell wall biosynthesis